MVLISFVYRLVTKEQQIDVGQSDQMHTLYSGYGQISPKRELKNTQTHILSLGVVSYFFLLSSSILVCASLLFQIQIQIEIQIIDIDHNFFEPEFTLRWEWYRKIKFENDNIMEKLEIEMRQNEHEKENLKMHPQT